MNLLISRSQVNAFFAKISPDGTVAMKHTGLEYWADHVSSLEEALTAAFGGELEDCVKEDLRKLYEGSSNYEEWKAEKENADNLG